jgi:hypothetical protein
MTTNAALVQVLAVVMLVPVGTVAGWNLLTGLIRDA